MMQGAYIYIWTFKLFHTIILASLTGVRVVNLIIYAGTPYD